MSSLFSPVTNLQRACWADAAIQRFRAEEAEGTHHGL